MASNATFAEVFLIFDSKTTQQMAERYLHFVLNHDWATAWKSKSFNEGLDAFNKLQMMTNPNNSNYVLQSTIDIMHRAVQEEEQTPKLFAILGEMLCYWWLGEREAVIRLQNDVKKFDFTTSWWNRYKGDIKETASAVIGFAMALATRNAAGGVTVAREGGKMGKSDREQFEKSSQDFEKVKKAIVSIKFK